MKDLTFNHKRLIPILTATEFNWLSAADRFFIGASITHTTNLGGRDVYIESREQMSGETLWIVKIDSWVLGKDNKYHYEPMPSSRTDEFINNTRFKTKEAALTALIEYENKFKETPPILTI